MSVQITIIGLGQIGASMGLALAAHKESILRVGHDKDINVERAALQKGAVEKTIHNLPSAVSGARLVVLAIPAHQVRETLEYISQDMQEGSIILDTSPIKAEAAKWTKELLPACHYIGLAPALNPKLLHEFSVGLEAARADLFTDGVFFISASYGIPESASTLAMDFVRLLGAQPILSDIAESDGLVTKTHLLPQLVSAALLNATIDQPGWQEARKVASRAYAAISSGVEYQDEIEALKTSVMQNRAGTVQVLDLVIAALRGLRDDLDKGDADGVAERLDAAFKDRLRWLNERAAADWAAIPKSNAETAPTFLERFFGAGIFKKPGKQ
jgi:prephenate dehydrogenase